ncbi:putative sulfite oxidase [Xylariaceae sp. FL0804]|nr:putative sulfite oxidase [Xylariaceae sp. FL0804]
MAVHAEEPLNREPDIAKLTSSFITEDGFDRNHCAHPPPGQLDAATHRVVVDGLVRHKLELSIAELQQDFEQHEVVCALQCAGNRRHDMRTLVKEVQGIDWFDAAVMNCRWRGPLLKDVLARAGVDLGQDGGGGSDGEDGRSSGEAHVAFASFQVECEDAPWFGSSIPLGRALDASREVVLALERNGRPLSVAHGFPVRAVVPGVAGARAVKWLDRVTVQRGESANHYMQRDYKALPPQAVDGESAEPLWGRTPPVMDMPVNSVVVRPRAGETVIAAQDSDSAKTKTGRVVACRGYALPSGDGGPVVRVEVSGDGGRSWTDARLEEHGDEGEGRWTWRFWTADVPVELGSPRSILSRATDAGGHTQPEVPPWNLRGVCYNGYGESRDLTVE